MSRHPGPDLGGAPGRGDAPVFIVGSPRSGTTLLYHMLLSAGRFVRYRSETHLFNALGPRFGGLRRPADRQAALAVWLQSDTHRLTGLPDEQVRSLIETRCTSTGDFLRLIMTAMGERQGMPRWAECTPAHLLHLREIHEQVPGALFVHVLRDGRDVAVSMARQGWVRPLPGDGNRPALAAGAFWRWLVERGRRQGRALGAGYLEIRYEDLIDRPTDALGGLAEFIGQSLDWDAIQRVGIGSVGQPNTSFPEAGGGFKGRWKSALSEADGHDLDTLLGPTLRAIGYPTKAGPASSGTALRGAAYTARFALRDWLKGHTPLGRRFTDLSLYLPNAMNVTEEKLAQAAGGEGP